MNNKIPIFVESLLTKKTDISIVTGTCFNFCDEIAEGRFRTACGGFHTCHIPREGRKGAVCFVSKSCCTLNKTCSFRTFEVLGANVSLLPDIQ